MNRNELLELFDREQRTNANFFGSRLEKTTLVARLVSLFDSRSTLIYSRLDEHNAEAAIQTEIDYFGAIGHDFEWKLYDHDTPADLGQRLVAHGFEREDTDAVLVLDLARVPPNTWSPNGRDVRKVGEVSSFADVQAVEEAVWNINFAGLISELSQALAEDTRNISIYVAYAGDRPVSCAWVRFHPGSQFASLWGGSTLPEYRQQGFYRSLLNVRANEAYQRGVRYLTVDASPMSRPILERLGFELLDYAHAYLWRLDSAGRLK